MNIQKYFPGWEDPRLIQWITEQGGMDAGWANSENVYWMLRLWYRSESCTEELHACLTEMVDKAIERCQDDEEFLRPAILVQKYLKTNKDEFGDDTSIRSLGLTQTMLIAPAQLSQQEMVDIIHKHMPTPKFLSE